MTDKKTTAAVEKILEESKKLKRKFKQNIDLVVNLKNLDLNNPKNRVNEEIVLPHGRGNEAKIALFASGELAVKSKKHVDLLMPTIGKTLGTVLGPRGKMPKPVPPHADVSGMVKNLRNTIKISSKSSRTFHTVAGNAEMSKEHIAENVDAIIKRLEGALERGRANIGSIYIKTTMGPPERII